MRFWHNLRMELLPYLYSVALDCAEASKPMMRPLVYQWPEDPLVWDCEDEFLLGDSLLVAPLLEENAEKRAVYLPEGQWIGLFDRRAAAGGQTIVAGGDRRLPVFLRAGYGLALRSDANSAPGAPAGERARRKCSSAPAVGWGMRAFPLPGTSWAPTWISPGLMEPST